MIVMGCLNGTNVRRAVSEILTLILLTKSTVSCTLNLLKYRTNVSKFTEYSILIVHGPLRSAF